MKTIFKKGVKPILMLAIAIGITSCLDRSKNKTANSQSSTAAVTKIASAKDLKGMKIGYCTPSLDAPYYQALLMSIKENTEINGMEFLSADGQGDINKQIAAVEDLINKEVKE